MCISPRSRPPSRFHRPLSLYIPNNIPTHVNAHRPAIPLRRLASPSPSLASSRARRLLSPSVISLSSFPILPSLLLDRPSSRSSHPPLVHLPELGRGVVSLSNPHGLDCPPPHVDPAPSRPTPAIPASAPSPIKPSSLCDQPRNRLDVDPASPAANGRRMRRTPSGSLDLAPLPETPSASCPSSQPSIPWRRASAPAVL